MMLNIQKYRSLKASHVARNLSMVFPKLHVDSSACVTIEASLLTSDGETWQLLRKENDNVLMVRRYSGPSFLQSLFTCIYLFDLKFLRTRLSFAL